tara:strand:- start:471 stop:2042 length:1572 start_codon:yes stop_codon:yes gene_type:complete
MKKISTVLLLMISTAYADVTGNLITNGTFDNGTTGWTTSGDAQRIGDCCPGGHDLEFGDSGSIEQDFNLYSDTITQPMLNNGITLNSTVEVQNGECGVQGCWGGSGPADSFTIRLQIRDENSNVLATTTQERYNVTGINGKDFTDSLTYTGIGSNIGNIYISGADSNSPASLGGANVDNISVTMTYDPTVLSLVETQIIATAFEQIEEVLTVVSPEELFIYEEFIVEEFIPFEEPELVIEMFSEIYIEEVAVEEINAGVVNVFTLAVPEELIEISPIAMIETFEEMPIIPIEMFEEIPMEVTYGNQETIEEISTEVEVPEERVEVEQTQNNETRVEGSESTEEIASEPEQNQPVERNANVEQGSERDTRTSSSETETIATEEPRESNTETDRDIGSTEEVVVESNVRENVPDVSIADIQRQVEQTTQSIDKQLVNVQLVVAKVMQNNTVLEAYSNKQYNDNNERMVNINIDEYILQDYTDNRQIYSDMQGIPVDIVAQSQTRISEAVSERIRTEEHLRRIRGY